MSADWIIRPATPQDVTAIGDIAKAAYARYVSRIGREPAPMVADFAAHIMRGEAYVLDKSGAIDAFVISYPRDTDQFIENVAVRPDSQGLGYGRLLMKYAEFLAQESHLEKLVLYTNVKMTENLAFYARLGYVEIKRISEHGFERVYFEKRLTYDS